MDEKMTLQELHEAQYKILNVLHTNHDGFKFHVMNERENTHETKPESNMILVRSSFFHTDGLEYAAIEMVHAGLDDIEARAYEMGQKFAKDRKRLEQNGKSTSNTKRSH